MTTDISLDWLSVDMSERETEDRSIFISSDVEPHDASCETILGLLSEDWWAVERRSGVEENGIEGEFISFT